LWATCRCISVGATPLLSGNGTTSKAQLKKLPTKIQLWADIIDSVNATPLAPAIDIRMAPYDADREAIREYTIRRYENLPGLLRLYALHLEKWLEFWRKTAKRLTIAQVQTIRLLRFVEGHTDGPHYEDMANLLEQGFFIAARKQSGKESA